MENFICAYENSENQFKYTVYTGDHPEAADAGLFLLYHENVRLHIIDWTEFTYGNQILTWSPFVFLEEVNINPFKNRTYDSGSKGVFQKSIV